MVDEATRRQQAEVERCALLELLLVLSQRPGQRMPAAQLRGLAAALHARLFVAPRRPGPAGSGEGDMSQYAVDLVRKCLESDNVMPDPRHTGNHDDVRWKIASHSSRLRAYRSTTTRPLPACHCPTNHPAGDGREPSSSPAARPQPALTRRGDTLRSGGAAGAPRPRAG